MCKVIRPVVAGRGRTRQGRTGQGKTGQGRAGQGLKSSIRQYIQDNTYEQTSTYGERRNVCGYTCRQVLHVSSVGNACSSSSTTVTSASPMQLVTCSMAWRMDTLPVMAATCSGVDPAGAVTSDITSRSTLRTIIDAPASSSRRTHSKLPLTAARCKAVSPFSALLSMYLNSTNQCLS